MTLYPRSLRDVLVLSTVLAATPGVTVLRVVLSRIR